MRDKFGVFRSGTARALLEMPGKTSPELRQAVAAGTVPAELEALVDKIHSGAYTVTDRDLDVLRSSVYRGSIVRDYRRRGLRRRCRSVNGSTTRSGDGLRLRNVERGAGLSTRICTASFACGPGSALPA